MSFASRDCSQVKFLAQSSFFQNHLEVRNPWDLIGIAPGTFCLVFDQLRPDGSDHVTVPEDFRLVEAIAYDDMTYHITLISSPGDHKSGERILKMADRCQGSRIESISIALICTDDSPYWEMVQVAMSHYRKVLPEAEICLAYFGEEKNVPSLFHVTGKIFPRNQFHMAYARNRALENCTGSHVLMVDLDCLLSVDDIRSLMDLYMDLPHNGVLNIKRPERPYPGNTLTFGERGKIMSNKFDERFKDFWFEDTEFLMNFSRIGIVPWTVWIPFQYKDHSRSHTLGKSPNDGLFETILKQGHR